MRCTKVFIAAIAVAGTAGLLSGCMSLTGTETGNGTSGMVMGPHGGPMEGAQVTLVPVDYNELEPSSGSNPICTTKTDAQGRYRFPDLLPGWYNLFCDSGSNAAYQDSLRVGGRRGDTVPTVFLKRSGAVTGTALVSSGRSAPSASVAIVGSRMYASVRSDDGSFHFSFLAPGTYHAKIITGEKSFFQRNIVFHAEEGRSDTIKSPFLLISTVVTALANDKTGIWIGTVNGLALLRDERWRVFGLPDGLSSSRINCLSVGTDGTLWTGTMLRLARIRNDTLTEDIFPAGMPAMTDITALARDSVGNLWVGTLQGLFMYNQGSIVRVNWNDALTGIGSVSSQNKLTAVSAILCPGRVTIVGTLHGVYFRDSSATWREVPEMANLAAGAMVCIGRNAVWMGTNQGMRKWDLITHAVSTPFDGQYMGTVTSLAAGADDSLYIGTAGGLFTAVDSTVVKKDFGGGSAGVNALARDGAGALWVGTNEGIVRIGPNGIQEIR
jgi:ligand-binding sensor domain-containing protein